MMPTETTLPPIEELLPHRGTMLLLDRVLHYAGDTVIAEYTPQSEAWYADSQGNMPGWIGIELMAQTVATHVGLSKREEGLPVKQGVLLGTRRYNARVAAFAANQALSVKVSMIFIDESGLGAYECQIASGDDELASATLKVYEPKDFNEFLSRGKHD